VRKRVYVPPSIDAPETRLAVATLCHALDACGAAPFGVAEERICRLLGWMCGRNPSETPPDGERGHFLDE
jgi:hypothetical protein